MKKVKYIGVSDEQVNFGNNDDPRKFLKEGKVYNVKREEVHSWHIKLELQEFPGKRFNSVSFEEVD